MKDNEKIIQISICSHNHPSYDGNDGILALTNLGRLFYGTWEHQEVIWKLLSSPI